MCRARPAPAIQRRRCRPRSSCPCSWPSTGTTTSRTPRTPHNDHLIFSKGHASPLYYAILKAIGAIDEQELMTYRRRGSRLEGHPTPILPWTDVATGSLGQGLPDRGRDRARRQEAGSAAVSDLDPVRRFGDGRRLHVGGHRPGFLRPTRPTDSDRRRQPTRPDGPDTLRMGPRPLRQPLPIVRLAFHRDRRPRRRGGRRRLRGGSRDHGSTDGDHRQDGQGQGRLRGGRQARRARQGRR